jgi:DNA-binding protein HU-beta
MTKAELIQKVQVEGLTKAKAAGLVDAVFAAVAGAIKKTGRFAYPGFGTFKVRKRKARQGRNPQTGKAITIKASKTVAFKAAPGLKGKL